MTYRSSRALRLAAMAGAALAAGLVLVPVDAQALGTGSRKPKPQPYRIAETETPRPADRAFFNYNYFSAVVEGGGSFGSYNGSLSGTFGPTPPGGSASTDMAFIGGDFQIPLTFLLSPAPMTRLPFTPVVGFSGRGHFGNGGTIPFHIHPTPVPSILTFERESTATFYGGVRVAVGDILGNGTQVVITPRAGVNIESGKLTFVTNEAGPVTHLSRSRTATGFHGGIDADFFFPAAGNGTFVPFVGLGVSVDTIPNISLAGRSALFDYRASTDSDVNITIKGRLGIAFSPR